MIIIFYCLMNLNYLYLTYFIYNVGYIIISLMYSLFKKVYLDKYYYICDIPYGGKLKI